MHLALVGRDPLSAELVRLAADLDVQKAAADAVACLEDDDLATRGDEVGRGDEAGDAGTDHGDVRCLPDHLVRIVETEGQTSV